VLKRIQMRVHSPLTVWEKLTFTDERLTLAFKSQLQLEEVLREVLRKQAIGAEVFTTAN
jgi:precorrin-6B methylase 1